MTVAVQRIADPEFYFQNSVMDLNTDMLSSRRILNPLSVAEIPKQQIANRQKCKLMADDFTDRKIFQYLHYAHMEQIRFCRVFPKYLVGGVFKVLCTFRGTKGQTGRNMMFGIQDRIY